MANMMFPPCGDSYVRLAFTARAVACCSRERHAQVAFRCSFLLRCQDFANEDELPEVIRVVVGGKEDLREPGRVAFRNLREEIDRLVVHDRRERIAIPAKL